MSLEIGDDLITAKEATKNYLNIVDGKLAIVFKQIEQASKEGKRGVHIPFGEIDLHHFTAANRLSSLGFQVCPSMGEKLLKILWGRS